MHDIVIKNGLLVDGTGVAPRAADIAIRRGRVAAVGGHPAGRREIDATGLIVAPGFIDSHTHDDRLPLLEPTMAAKLSQGVTTVVTGNCGISALPMPLSAPPTPPLTLLGLQTSAFFPSFQAFDAAVTAARPALNRLALVGHTSLRAATMADLSRPASAGEIATMQSMLRQALAEGAAGMSTGLYYPPAQAAPACEVEALLAVVAAAGGLQTTHLRSEGDGLLAALEEALGSARQTGVPLVISHLKCASPAMWGRAAEALAVIDRAAQHQPLAFDVYPYDASSTMLRCDRVSESRRITISWSEPHPEAAGQDLAAIAAAWCCTPQDAAARLLPAGGIFYKMEEGDVRQILAHPCAMIGSDGLPHDRHPHPRLWGTFPRVLGRYVRDLGLLSLEDAVRRMTSLPAQVFGLVERGIVAEGMAADLAVFNAAEVSDGATYDQPVQPCQGVAYVLVNGAIAWADGAATGQRRGQRLRRVGMAAA